MKKQVPEGVASKEEQVVALLQALEGHEIFARRRGNCGWGGLGLVDHLIDKADSPTHFCELWDQLTADLRVLGNMLAKYRRDGWAFAEDELSAALARGNEHLLPGETAPIQETTPVTVVMLDPARTLTMTQWVLGGGEYDMYYAINKGEYKTPLVQKLFESFPGLAEKSKSMRDVDSALLVMLYNHVFEHFPKYRQMKGRRLKIGSAEGDNNLSSYANVIMHVWGDSQRVGVYSFGFLVFAEQDKVLRRFSRKQQEQIGTWQLHLPCTLIEKVQQAQVSFKDQWWDGHDPVPRVSLGFFPEAEHAHWQKLFPAMTSRGVAHGFGVIAAMGGMRRTQLNEEVFPTITLKKPEELRFWLES